jgi:hypothetical protein
MSETENRVADLRHPRTETPSSACSDSGIPNTDGIYPASRNTSRHDLPHQSRPRSSNEQAKLTFRHAVKRRQNSSLPPESNNALRNQSTPCPQPAGITYGALHRTMHAVNLTTRDTRGARQRAGAAAESHHEPCRKSTECQVVNEHQHI